MILSDNFHYPLNEPPADFKPAGFDIYHDLKEQIIRGELKPGDHLPGERALMDIYHRSRATVREALHLLERAGFIQILPRKRPVVIEYTDTGIRKPLGEAFEANHISLSEIREFRTVIEGEMAGWAAERRSEEDVLRLKACVEEMENSVDDYLRFLDLDTEFHSLVASACKNRACHLMTTSVSSISREFTRQDLLQFSPEERRRRCLDICRLHVLIYEKIRDQDTEGAKIAMRDHLAAFEKDLVDNEMRRLDMTENLNGSGF